MKAKIFRTLGVIGFIVAMGSLSACFEESYYPSHLGYAYGSPGYGYPGYAPAPRYYAYNPHPYASNPHRYWQDRQWGKHEGHAEHERHEHQDHDRL
jgi:hypothetical protein